MKQEEIQNQLKMLDVWKEAYWNAMRDGSISKLDQSKLDFLSKKLNLTEEDKNKVIASFERNETEFVELINEIFKNNSANNLDLEKLEHIDFIRQECCISEKEASEFLQQKTFNNKIIENKDKISIEWIKNLIPDKEGIEMVFVEGGEFIMGDAEFEDAPPHKVTVSSFYIGKYPVTQAQWEAVMGNNPSEFKNCENCPVENVSWYDCQEFIQKLNAKTGKTYRLPTEAEWEYAARGGKRSKGYKYAGSNEIEAVAWYYKNNENKTHPVGQKSPNELGIYDMSGNVWEWCNDWYGDYRLNEAYAKNPQGPDSGTCRVLRGGSWGSGAGGCLVADRDSGRPDGWGDNLGFRLLSPVE
jgi:formylglycine-generating enzyme required for sulfatase activity